MKPMNPRIDIICLNHFKSVEDRIFVKPSSRLFAELGNTPYEIEDLVCELIDNSLAASVSEITNIYIDLGFDRKNRPIYFTIRDDASGIEFNELPLVVSPGAKSSSTNPLNEHGLGLKQAVAAMGTLEYLTTRSIKEDLTSTITKLDYGEIPVIRDNKLSTHGTEIKVSITENSKMRNKTEKFYKDRFIEFIGATYRRFLRPGSRKAFIKVNYYDYNNHLKTTVDVVAVSPTYYSNGTDNPLIFNFPITGEGYEARLTFGFSPRTDYERQELGIDEITGIYSNTLEHQGLDLIMNGKVLVFHQLSELKLVKSRHNQYNYVRGEIELIHGFKTFVTKNGVVNDSVFAQCIEQIRKILNGESEGPEGLIDYLGKASVLDIIPEACLRDRLKSVIDQYPDSIYPSKENQTEHVVEYIEGKIDIYSLMNDGSIRIWELKNEDAVAKDVYQLYMYMDVEGASQGYLVAKSFSKGAEFAANFIKENHQKNVDLVSIGSFPITNPMTPAEKEKYQKKGV